MKDREFREMLCSVTFDESINLTHQQLKKIYKSYKHYCNRINRHTRWTKRYKEQSRRFLWKYFKGKPPENGWEIFNKEFLERHPKERRMKHENHKAVL